MSWADFYDYDITQELLNGMLWVLGLHMVLAKVMYLIVTYSAHRKNSSQKYTVVMRGPWYRRQDVQLTIAWMIFLVGFTVLRWWVWRLRECMNDLGVPACEDIEDSHYLLYWAAAFCMLGGLCSIRIMLPGRWQPWSWIYVLVVSMVVPFVYRLWL